MRTKIPSLDRRSASHKQKNLNYAELSDNESLLGSFFKAGNKPGPVHTFPFLFENADIFFFGLAYYSQCSLDR